MVEGSHRRESVAAVRHLLMMILLLSAGNFILATTGCENLPGVSLGVGSVEQVGNVTWWGACCELCNHNPGCLAWQYHAPQSDSTLSELCFLKGNVAPSGRPVDQSNHTMSGHRSAPIPIPPLQLACLPPHDKYPFCDTSMDTKDRIMDLISRIDDADKPNLLTARGRGGNGQNMQSFPQIGVPAYYWGMNCLHSVNGGKCVFDDNGVQHCPTNFPSGPAMGAMFDRELVKKMANVVGVELRAMFRMNVSLGSLDCWGPVVNLNRDPRWGRNGEGGLEDAYAMGELAKAWTTGFQDPRPSKTNSSKTLYQGILTLKHMDANSLENTAPYNRHTFDANSTYGVDNFVAADYYLIPFKKAIRDAGARGIMCSYNSVMGVPTCLSPLMKNARDQWGFEGYVTSDSDAVRDAYVNHMYVPTGLEATALALTKGQCDVNSGDTYNDFLINATTTKTDGLTQMDVDRAVYNTLKQRFDLGLFDPAESYEWPTVDKLGSQESFDLTLNASQKSLVILRNDGNLLPISPGKKIAVIGPHAAAKEVLIQPYPFPTVCNDTSFNCLKSPIEAISDLNVGGETTTAPGCDLFNTSQSGFAEALALAKVSDIVVLGLGIETCGMNPAHNVNPARPGRCYQEKFTTGYVFPDQYLELEAHDRTIIDLPPIQHELAAAVLALNKPTVIFLMNGGAVAFEAEATYKGTQPIAIIEAFYPGPRGGEALARGIFGLHNNWGRLPYTIYKPHFVDQASMTEHDLRVAPGRTYRYHNDSLFDFGAGMSLTTWTLGGSPVSPCMIDTSSSTDYCNFDIQAQNTGTRDGDVVVLGFFRCDSQKSPEGMMPLRRQLFDFQRITVAKGGLGVAKFAVTRESVAQVNSDGDLVAAAGTYDVLFWDGDSQWVTNYVTLTGKDVVLEPFPSST